jgi:hypothetical protein
MSPTQKIAWFTLAVIALTVLSFLGLTILVGRNYAMLSFALLGLQGLNPLFFKKKGGRIKLDERDVALCQQSMLIGFYIFLVYYGAAGVAPFALAGKSIPEDIYFILFVGGILVLLAGQSAALLVQSGGLTGDSPDFFEKLRGIDELTFVSGLNLALVLPVLIVFVMVIPVGGENLSGFLLGLLLFLATGFIFFVLKSARRNIELEEWNEKINHRAERMGIASLGATLAIGGLALAAIYLDHGLGWVFYCLIPLVGFCGFAVALVVQPVSVLVQYFGGRKGKDTGK